MIDIETHKELYMFDSIERIKQSLEYAKQLPSSGFTEPTTFLKFVCIQPSN